MLLSSFHIAAHGSTVMAGFLLKQKCQIPIIAKKAIITMPMMKPMLEAPKNGRSRSWATATEKRSDTSRSWRGCMLVIACLATAGLCHDNGS